MPTARNRGSRGSRGTAGTGTGTGLTTIASTSDCTGRPASVNGTPAPRTGPTADGSTGFYWTAGGGPGTIRQTDGSGYALTLADNNAVLGLTIASTLASNSTITGASLGGIDGRNTSDAWLAGRVELREEK